ncbi:MAG: hypothetical protein ACRD5H_02670 [Nitrososphaerales archaeon]
MAVVKANYVKRGTGEKGRAKASIRYITHRRDRDNHTVTRTLFGFDGQLSKQQAYKMIDEANKGTIFYRFVLSPDPKREDRYKDLSLSEITLDTILKLEERLGKHVQFVATIHNDHSPHRHVHTLVLVQRKLTRDDFRSLRDAATEQALSQRRTRDRMRDHHIRLRRPRNAHYRVNRKSVLSSTSAPLYQSYTCRLCNYTQALPPSRSGYRCPSCGLYLRRYREKEFFLTQRREAELELSLSP